MKRVGVLRSVFDLVSRCLTRVRAQALALIKLTPTDQILFGKKFGQEGRFNAFGNLGVAILTAPTELFSQNDVFTYGAAGSFASINSSASPEK